MKAIQIMMFLFIFNLSIAAITVTNIYDMSSYELENQSDVIEDVESGEDLSSNFLFRWFTETFGIGIIATAIATLTSSKLSEWMNAGLQGKDFWTIGIFSGTFIPLTYSSARIFIGVGGQNIGSYIIISIFLLVSGVIFVLGLIQLVQGVGWRSFE